MWITECGIAKIVVSCWYLVFSKNANTNMRVKLNEIATTCFQHVSQRQRGIIGSVRNDRIW